MRRKVIAGNWKMNMLPDETIRYIDELSKLVGETQNEVILCVPFTDLFYALLTAQNTNIKIGAQNMRRCFVHLFAGNKFVRKWRPQFFTSFFGMKIAILRNCLLLRFFCIPIVNAKSDFRETHQQFPEPFHLIVRQSIHWVNQDRPHAGRKRFLFCLS